MGGKAPHILIALRDLSALEFFGLQQQLVGVDWVDNVGVDEHHLAVGELGGQVVRYVHQLVRDSDLVLVLLLLGCMAC